MHNVILTDPSGRLWWHRATGRVLYRTGDMVEVVTTVPDDTGVPRSVKVPVEFTNLDGENNGQA